MNRDYLDGFVAIAGSTALVHGLINGNLDEAAAAGASMMLYEAGQLGLELYRDRRERQFMSRMIRSRVNPFEIADRKVRLP
ncbi:MAG: hypothetical protein HY517_03430 [Candidatus Aenigmarchaeota archaeon]|nr:hypothetical protein [Candidatus Aenigmarchaeota archaeon]